MTRPRGFAEAPQTPFAAAPPRGVAAFRSYQAIEQGIPATEVAALEAWGLSREDIRSVVPTRTLERRLADGDVLRLEEADGLARLLRVTEAARELFTDPALAHEFLHLPHPDFHDTPAIQVARTDIGAREVEAVIGRIAHGVYF